MNTSIETLKKDLKTTAEDAADAAPGLGVRLGDFAKTNVVQPLSKAASEASDAISQGYREGKEVLKSKRDGASGWISSNPFAGVLIGVAVGALIGAISRGKS